MATVGTKGAIRQPPADSANLGQGISYPPAYDAGGRLKLSSGINSVSEALTAIAQTIIGERPMQPDFGGGTQLFDPISDPARFKIRMKTSISEHEPRVDSFDIKVGPGINQGELQVDMVFTVRGDATPQNLTFPLFLGPSI